MPKPMVRFYGMKVGLGLVKRFNRVLLAMDLERQYNMLIVKAIKMLNGEPLYPELPKAPWKEVMTTVSPTKLREVGRREKRKPEIPPGTKELADMLYQYAKRYGWRYLEVFNIAKRIAASGIDINMIDPSAIDWSDKSKALEQLQQYAKPKHDWRTMKEKIEYQERLAQRTLLDFV